MKLTRDHLATTKCFNILDKTGISNFPFILSKELVEIEIFIHLQKINNQYCTTIYYYIFSFKLSFQVIQIRFLKVVEE